VRSLAVGLVVGAACQFVLQWPALRGMRFHPTIDLAHPVLRRILRLYAPVILGMGATEVGIFLDRNLASRLGEATISSMRFATTLREFPLGLVSIAVATAILPTLARKAIQELKGDSPDGSASSDFRATLASGLRLVLVLTLPAAAGLLVLARPVVALLFQHGAFDANDAAQTALALRYYLIGLVFAAIDQPLVFAFYARKDTRTPALVGVLGVLFYLGVALLTFRALGMVGLILANGAQLAGHAAVMIWHFQRKVGTLAGHGLPQTLLKAALASTLMGAAVYGTARAVEGASFVQGRAGSALVIAASGVVGVGIYLGLCALLHIREIELARALVRQTWHKVRTLRTGRH
jgi:putative peptidoglycan lipid II flippase